MCRGDDEDREAREIERVRCNSVSRNLRVQDDGLRCCGYANDNALQPSVHVGGGGKIGRTSIEIPGELGWIQSSFVRRIHP